MYAPAERLLRGSVHRSLAPGSVVGSDPLRAGRDPDAGVDIFLNDAAVGIPDFSVKAQPQRHSPQKNKKNGRSRIGRTVSHRQVAERQGFEPWRRFPAYTRSRRAPSTTRPPLRQGGSSRKTARYARVERRLIGVLEDLGQDTSRTVEPGRHRQVLRPQKFRVVDLRLVARAVVAKDRHDGLAGAEIAGEAHRPGDVDARGAAE